MYLISLSLVPLWWNAWKDGKGEGGEELKQLRLWMCLTSVRCDLPSVVLLNFVLFHSLSPFSLTCILFCSVLSLLSSGASFVSLQDWFSPVFWLSRGKERKNVGRTKPNLSLLACLPEKNRKKDEWKRMHLSNVDSSTDDVLTDRLCCVWVKESKKSGHEWKGEDAFTIAPCPSQSTLSSSSNDTFFLFRVILSLVTSFRFMDCDHSLHVFFVICLFLFRAKHWFHLERSATQKTSCSLSIDLFRHQERESIPKYSPVFRMNETLLKSSESEWVFRAKRSQMQCNASLRHMHMEMTR